MAKTRPAVLKEWMFTLPFRMQSVVMAALRGCDTARKDDNSKFITRGIRSVVLNNADPTNTFIIAGNPDEKRVKDFLWDLDSYPMHFIMHTAHAAEIIGYKHPAESVATWWLDLYKKIVLGLHLNFETEEQLDVRLGFTPAEKAVWIEAVDTEDVVRAYHEKHNSPPPAPLETPAPVLIAVPPPAPIPATMPPVPEERWEAGTGTSHGNTRGKRTYTGSS